MRESKQMSRFRLSALLVVSAGVMAVLLVRRGNRYLAAAKPGPVMAMDAEPVVAEPVAAEPVVAEPVAVEPEPVAQPEPEPVVIAEPEPVVIAEPEPEPEPEPIVVPEPEPAPIV